MRKFFALLLALVLVVGLVACGSKEAAKSEEGGWPGGHKEVTVLIPQDVGSMLDQSTRIMIDYLNEACPYTKFVAENDASGGGNKAGLTLAAAEGDGSVIMAHGAGAIVQYYSGTWEKNLGDPNTFIAICGNVGQLQPSGGVFLTPVTNDKFTDLPSFVDYVKAHPGEVRVAYATGTPHEIRLKLITNYYGISDMISWQPGSSNDVRTWINGGNVELACLTETQAVADIKGGKVVGILNSLVDRNYTDDLKEVLDNVPIVTDYIDRAEAEALVCAWPMTIYGPASMSEETAKAINDICKGIADKPEYMERIKALGASNTYQIFSYEEINEITQDADKQIKAVFESFAN